MKTTEEDIKKQIDCIIEFQNIMTPYNENLKPRIGSILGKEVQNNIIEVKQLKNDISEIEGKKEKNLLDKFLIKNKIIILEKAENSIKNIYENGYYEILKRAMMNYEVCLGKSDENNLRYKGNQLEVGSLKYFAYNNKEMDFFSYYKKLIRRGICIDKKGLMYYFINKSNLKSESYIFIESLCSYPIETMRAIEKYRRGKKNITDIECIEIINSYGEF